MSIRKICPAAVNGLLSRVSRTQPVPSIAACFAGSARTAKMASAGALMTLVALTASSATLLPPHSLSDEHLDLRRVLPDMHEILEQQLREGLAPGEGGNVLFRQRRQHRGRLPSAMFQIAEQLLA